MALLDEYSYQKIRARKISEGICVAATAQVVKFDKEKMTVNVQPLSKYLERGRYQSHPQILRIPVVCFRSGGFLIRPWIEPGDIGIILYLDHDMDKTITKGEEAQPLTERVHATSDAVFLGGVITGDYVVPGDEIPDRSHVIATEDGIIYAAVQDDRITLRNSEIMAELTSEHFLVDTRYKKKGESEEEGEDGEESEEEEEEEEEKPFFFEMTHDTVTFQCEDIRTELTPEHVRIVTNMEAPVFFDITPDVIAMQNEDIKAEMTNEHFRIDTKDTESEGEGEDGEEEKKPVFFEMTEDTITIQNEDIKAELTNEHFRVDTKDTESEDGEGEESDPVFLEMTEDTITLQNAETYVKLMGEEIQMESAGGINIKAAGEIHMDAASIHLNSAGGGDEGGED